ncbi:minor capsid protein [Sediminibacillus massiliensis]|uniref:minor capsid protein n=1 Tax=Sediminibacillus massiliensis TaxID=1926277 RepID=UPI0009883A30|nr:minor capsid protein [Sediminibacillus massiliensis]
MFNVKVEFFDIEKKIDDALGHGQKYLDGEILKDSNFYIPARTWNLRDSGVINTKVGSGEVVWKTKYARRLYYNPYYDFSTDKNPNARGFWFENAKAQFLKEWLDGAEKEVKKHI